MTTGACIRATGKLVASRRDRGRPLEIQAETIEILGDADESYPLQKKGHTLEFPARDRALASAVRTPSAPSSGCVTTWRLPSTSTSTTAVSFTSTPRSSPGPTRRGAGEMFQVTTLDLQHLPKLPDGSINFKETFR